MSGALSSAYDLAFQVSPIILTGGIASGLLGSALPIVGLVGQLASFGQGALSGALSPNDFYARYLPVAGSNVINNSVGMYPFANQRVAANAVIEEPTTISLQMIAPVKDKGGYLTKLAIFTALRTSLQNHNVSGGLYDIATPSFIYDNCLMTGMTDITPGDSKQVQIIWQLDFVRPLVTQQQAANAFSALMGKAAGGQPINGIPAWSGSAVSTGTQAPGALSAIAGGASQLAGGVNTFLSGAAL